ncbi:MAG: helix-turn-helix domain-containing protein [Halanaerobium sp. MSAO_Bac5]|nr:MAG: helix-turn-helix domain-containing protein [Halanaerobium sp. MSAO_Bac5]
MEELELGTLLKKARMEKGLSLDEIQEKTKIRKVYLEAIEKNEFDKLPGSVYLKVFVKGYAREVDINYQKLLENYSVLNIVEEKKEKHIQEDYLSGTNIKHNRGKKKKTKGFFKIILFVFLGFLIIMASIYAFQYFTNADQLILDESENDTEIVEQQDESEELTATYIEEENVLISSSIEEELNLLDTSLEGLINDAQLHEEEAIIDISERDLYDQQINISERPAIIIDDSRLELAPEDDFSAEEGLSDLNQEIALETESEEIESEENQIDNLITINADDLVWLRVDSDGETVFSGLLEAGESLEYEAEEILYMRIGRPRAVTVQINDQEFGPWTETGDISEIEILIEEDGFEINNLRE